MRKLRDGLRLRLAAARAGEGLGSGLGLRRLLGHFAVVPCVAERVRVSIHIAITAGAGVGRVALFRARRSGDDSLVAVLVRELRDGLRLRLAAARAGEGFDAGLSLRRLLGHFAIVPCVAERVRVSVHVAVTTGAGVGRVALGRTGWSGHSRRVIMGVRSLPSRGNSAFLRIGFAVKHRTKLILIGCSRRQRYADFFRNVIADIEIGSRPVDAIVTRGNDISFAIPKRDSARRKCALYACSCSRINIAVGIPCLDLLIDPFDTNGWAIRICFQHRVHVVFPIVLTI